TTRNPLLRFAFFSEGELDDLLTTDLRGDMTTNLPTLVIRDEPLVAIGVVLHLDGLPVVLFADIAPPIVHRDMTRRAHLADGDVFRQVRRDQPQPPGAPFPAAGVLAPRMLQTREQFPTAEAGGGGVFRALNVIGVVEMGLQLRHAA